MSSGWTWRTNGDTLCLVDIKSALLRHVKPSKGCWNWSGLLGRDGYPLLRVGKRRLVASRLSYAVHNGPIPEGLVIDHLCRNRGCINPTHLEAVTQSENLQRGLRGVLKSQCANGHPYTKVYRSPTTGKRMCRICTAQASRRYQERKRSNA